MKFLVVDDHVLIRQALREVLRCVRADADVLEATSASQATQILAAEPRLSLALLDIGLPDRHGLDLLAEIKTTFPLLPIVVLSATQDPACMMRALELGAAGYIPKSAAAEVIVGALNLVLSGGIYVPPEILLHREFHEVAAPPDEAHQKLVTVASQLGLSDRHVKVLSLLVQGKPNKLISRTLNVTDTLVKKHVAAIFKALKVRNRTEAAAAVRRLGLVLPEITE